MDAHVRVGGAWKRINKIHVKVGGAWKEVLNGYVKVGGAWKQFFVVGVVTVSGEAITDTRALPDQATASVIFNDDGTVEKQEGPSALLDRTQIDVATDWIIPNNAAPGDYQVRYTNFTGDAVSATAAEDAWHALSGGSFSVTLAADPTPGTKSCSFTIQIRKGTGAVLDSATYTLDVEAT